MKALILAAGKGEGLSPYTEKMQKEAIRIAGKPVILYSIEGLLSVGITEFTIVVNEKEEQILNSIKDVDADIETVRQKTPGISGAILDGMEKMDDMFVLAFGDIITPREFYKELLATFHRAGSPVFSTVPISSGFDTYGLVKVNEGLHVVTEGSTLALAGAYIIPKRPFKNFLQYLDDIAKDAEYFVWSGSWTDIGYPEDIIRSIEELLRSGSSRISNKARIASTAVIGNSVIIEEGAVIEDFAIVKGPAYIGKDVYVGSFSLIRDSSSIEDGALIGAYSEIAHSLIGRRAVIGSKSYVTYSVIGDEAKIGASVITASYPATTKRQGTDKFGALISPGESIPHGSVVGPSYRK
ncbi:sugar phosphate nucleotidyltransferase [Metallosphaera hakonensis]|uniref:Nucleotidyltransferase n=1 Tax=Metallosphaera hakonensis JCM 8857 = DSM 7519 TaxID=1293036 RepID=A0A2U9IVH3_9CREN|nr:NDP-sugar synthase [Metallosphaera hakonensis]AWS00071.1 NTP transferase domain-containing protein [Metallosphaera hakonensis JCM 8857 = DSM 7519]